jgi:hypothetical protein
MRPVCWGCCGVPILLIAAMAAFTVWTIAATNPVWKAEDVGSANYMVPFCKLKPVEAFTNPNAAYLHGRCIGILENVTLTTDVCHDRTIHVHENPCWHHTWPNEGCGGEVR